MPKTLLVTGSSSLIGSEVCIYFARELGYTSMVSTTTSVPCSSAPRARPAGTNADDHICYYSDLRKMRAHYPASDITQSLEENHPPDRRGLARPRRAS